MKNILLDYSGTFPSHLLLLLGMIFIWFVPVEDVIEFVVFITAFSLATLVLINIFYDKYKAVVKRFLNKF